MKKKQAIKLGITLVCILLVLVMCLPKKEPTKEEMVQEYWENKEAFLYVRNYLARNDIMQIRRSTDDKIELVVKGLEENMPLEDAEDELFVQYAHLLFDDLNYWVIYDSWTYKQNIQQLIFEKRTNKTYYYKNIIFCEDNLPPVNGMFFHEEQIDENWFYCEEDPLYMEGD